MSTTIVSIATTDIHVLGMSCVHCQQAVTQALSDLPGVTHVTVDLPRGVATIHSDAELDPIRVGAAVFDAGYDTEWVA